MATFATITTLKQGESPSLYKAPYEDKAIKADTDGGYEFRRDRHTRPPRRTFETGFISISHADFELLEAFYLDQGHTGIWVWRDYIRGVNRNVRFDAFEPDYVGVGTNRMWNLKIKMSEV